ncbi:SAV_6107 family HEPN domain-containing protein [Streptomyces sp. NPDC054813]
MESANGRFATAHLAALRTAAAVLAARGRPPEGASDGRRRRIRSAWDEVPVHVDRSFDQPRRPRAPAGMLGGW